MKLCLQNVIFGIEITPSLLSSKKAQYARFGFWTDSRINVKVNTDDFVCSIFWAVAFFSIRPHFSRHLSIGSRITCASWICRNRPAQKVVFVDIETWISWKQQGDKAFWIANKESESLHIPVAFVCVCYVWAYRLGFCVCWYHSLLDFSISRIRLAIT